MSKIWLAPASIYTGEPYVLEGIPEVAPGVVRAFLSIESFLEHYKPKVGEKFSFFSLHGYRRANKEGIETPYGSVLLENTFDAHFHDNIVITDEGKWEWVNGGDSEVAQRQRAERMGVEYQEPEKRKIPENMMKFFEVE